MRNGCYETAVATVIHSDGLENGQACLGEVYEKEYHEVETWVVTESFVYWAEPVSKKKPLKVSIIAFDNVNLPT